MVIILSEKGIFAAVAFLLSHTSYNMQGKYALFWHKRCSGLAPMSLQFKRERKDQTKRRGGSKTVADLGLGNRVLKGIITALT